MERGIPVSFYGGACALHAVQQYQHLGSNNTMSGSSVPEACRRARRALGALRQFGHTILANHKIDTEKRGQLANVLVLSRALHNCGAWPRPRAAEGSRLHTTITAMHRTVAGMQRWRKVRGSCDGEVYQRARGLMHFFIS